MSDIHTRFKYRGKRDSADRFHVFGTVTFDDGDVVTSEFRHGVRHGSAVIESQRNDISRLCGTYVDGKMQGRAKLVSTIGWTSLVEFRGRGHLKSRDESLSFNLLSKEL